MTVEQVDRVKSERVLRANELVSKLAHGVTEFADLDPGANSTR